MSIVTPREQKLLIAGLIIAVIVVAVILTMSVSIPSTGTIAAVGIGIYADPSCTTALTSVNWGTRHPGENASLVFWIRNTQNTNVTLSLTVSNWNPVAASTYITVSWNYTSGKVLRPAQILPLTLKLAVSPTITGINSFSNTMTFTGTEYNP